MAACTHSLLGDPPPQLTSLRPPQSGALASISEVIQVHRKYWRSLRLMKMEDKEERSSSRLVIKKLPQSASPVSAKGMTTPKGKVLEAGMRKPTAALPTKESTLGQAKAKTAKALLAQGQSSEQAAKGTTLDLATSKDTVGGATTDQCASVAATENSANQTTSGEEASGETESFGTSPSSNASKQTTGASPLHGAAAQQSPELGLSSTLELSSEAQEVQESEEGLLGEAAGGQDMNSLMLTQGFGDFNTQDVFYAVTPLSWCPHLMAVCPIPAAGLDVSQPCKTCGSFQENWVCLTCYQVYCSRYVNAHMVCHHEASEHPLVLSCVDLSTWCYLCQAYVHHEDLQDVKNAAHQNKFGEGMPHLQ